MHLTAVGKLNYNDATCILLRTCCFVCKIVHFIAHYNPNMMYGSPEFHIHDDCDMKKQNNSCTAI